MKNNYSSYEKNKVLKITLITITTAILAVGAFLGGGYVRRAQWESELRKNYSYAFIGEDREVEYGTEIRIVDLKKELLDVDLSLENIKISINGKDQTSDKIYKFLKINDNKVKCTLSDVIDGEQIIVARTYMESK